MKKKFMRVSWKKNFRKVPELILEKVKSLQSDNIIVAGVKRLSETDMLSGSYAHLKMNIANGKPTFQSSLIPETRVGKYSFINTNGSVVVRKDLPMIAKSYHWEAPNYGDWGKGSHTVSIARSIYRRTFVPPKELELIVDLLAEEVLGDKTYVFKVKVDTVLNKNSDDFSDSLFYTLNLLQENFGEANVFASDASLSDYLRTTYVNWEILPPGDRNETIARILAGFRTPSEEIKSKLIARYELLNGLGPIAFIQGMSGFRRYFGAKFRDDLIVFENLEYGNAIYIMFANWENLSKLNRLELLSGKHDGFERIVHRTGWESKLRSLINSARGVAEENAAD